MSSKLKEEIKLEALGLSVGETTREIPCPSCNSKGDFTVTREESGLLYHCYRASCDLHGFIPSLGYELATHSVTPSFTPKHFNRPLRQLPVRIKTWLKETYYLTDRQIRDNELKYDYTENRLWQPITSHNGMGLGCTVKKLPRQFATADCDIESYLAGAKSVAYWESEAPHLDFPIDPPAVDRQADSRICLVEDKLSAIRVNRFMRCASLCGSNIDDHQVAALSQLTRCIVLALDFDTWYSESGKAKSVKFWEKYKLFFKTFELRMIYNDPKDMRDEEIQREIVR